MDTDQLAPAASSATDDTMNEMPLKEPAEKPRKAWAWLVALAVALTVFAWVMMVYSGAASFGLSVAGFVASVAGAILVGKGTWRSLSITSAIAAGVLAIVFTLLWAALRIIVG